MWWDRPPRRWIKKVSGLLVKDTEEMVGWRVLSECLDENCWDKRGRFKVENQQKRSLQKEEVHSQSGDWYEGARNTGFANEVEDYWARIFSRFREYNLQRKQCMQEGSTEEEEMKQEQRLKAVKDMIRKNRMQATVGGLLSCWLPTAKKCGSIREWEDTVQKWNDWLCEMKKKDAAKKMEEEHWKKVSRMIKRAEWKCRFLHNITKPMAWRGGMQILKEEEEDANPMARCEGKDRVCKNIGRMWHGSAKSREQALEERTCQGLKKVI